MAVKSKGIVLKKKHGQNFLRDQNVLVSIISNVSLCPKSSILEIGCGDGFLTKSILSMPIARLWGFEIDVEWAEQLKNEVDDERFVLFSQDILTFDFSELKKHSPWTLLANLPYHLTFPILFLMQKHRELFAEGVVMIQEEVAQKIVKTRGRGYGFNSLFFQYYFDWKLLDKISPEAFYPQPKVFSRLLWFKPKDKVAPIPNESEFWKFIKNCFAYPRRTLRNNLVQTDYDTEKFDQKTLAMRAQQLNIQDLLALWKKIDV